MHRDDIHAFVAVYLKYLHGNRLPERLPTSKREAEEMIAEIKQRASANPYDDEVYSLFGLIHEQPSLAWEICLAIVSKAEESELAIFGAGDLETFVSNNAVAFADAIEAEIRTNPSFRKAFESLYIGSDVPAQVGRRFNVALRELGVAEESIIDWWSNEPASGEAD